MGRGKPSNPFMTMSIQCLLIFRNLYRVRSHTRCISFKSNIDERQQERRHTLVVKNLSAKCRRYKIEFQTQLYSAKSGIMSLFVQSFYSYLYVFVS